MRPGVEALVEEAARMWREGGILVFEAPTGYGKTRAGPRIYGRLRGVAERPRVIHVLPLRSVVEEAYTAYRGELGGDVSVGYQAHGISLLGKTPFYAADAVVSTLDSFAFNLYRSSVGESGLGHYEVPRAHIVSSLAILDEAHLPLASREAPATAMMATIYVLASMGVPVVVETATMPPATLRALLDHALPPGVKPTYIGVTPGGGGRPSWLPGGAGYKPVEDADYYEWASQLEWRYYPLPAAGLDDVVEITARLAGEGLRVFLASSRVRVAVDAYKALRGRLGPGRVALIHGRLTAADRAEHVERARGARVIVGTSAVEAGVNIDADAVVTDVPAVGGRIAWDSLIQRLGRACRSPGKACGVVEVYLYGPRAGEAYSALVKGGVNPRIPGTYRGLLDSMGPPSLDPARYQMLAELALRNVTHERIEEAYRALCQPFRGDALIPIAVPSPEAAARGGEALARDALDALAEGRYVLASLEQARERAGDWLLRLGNGYAALRAGYPHAHRGHPGDVEAGIVSLGREELRDCRRAARLAALIARPEAYEPGVGMA